MTLSKITKKWPFDAAITIALLALVISIGQFLLTAPIVNGLFVGPKLVVRGKGSDPKAEVLVGSFNVANEGNSPATKIELGLVLQVDQRVNVMPNFGATIIEEKSPAFVKNIRIEVERLTPGENFFVMVLPGPSNQKLDAQVANFMVKSGIKEIPGFSFLRSAEGIGKFAPPEPVHRSGAK